VNIWHPPLKRGWTVAGLPIVAVRSGGACSPVTGGRLVAIWTNTASSVAVTPKERLASWPMVLVGSVSESVKNIVKRCSDGQKRKRMLPEYKPSAPLRTNRKNKIFEKLAKKARAANRPKPNEGGKRYDNRH